MLHQNKNGTLLCSVLFYFSKSLGDLKGSAQRTARCAVRPSHRSARRRASPLCSAKKERNTFVFCFLFFKEHRELYGLGTENSTVHCSTELPLRPQAGKSPMLHQKKNRTLLCSVLFYFSKSIGDLKGSAQRTARCAVRPSCRSARRRASPLCSAKRVRDAFVFCSFFKEHEVFLTRLRTVSPQNTISVGNIVSCLNRARNGSFRSYDDKNFFLFLDFSPFSDYPINIGKQ